MEENKICAVTEASDKFFHFTRTSIYSFIEHNPWFNGTLKLLVHQDLPLSQKNLLILRIIYPNIEVLSITAKQTDKIKTLHSFKNSNKYLELLANNLKAFMFTLPQRKLLYFSNTCLFLNNISDILIPGKITSDSKFSIAYLDKETDITSYFNQGLLFNNLIELMDSPEYSIIPFISTHASSITNAKFDHASSSKLKSVPILVFDITSSESSNYSKINQIWLHKNHEVIKNLQKPTTVTKNITIQNIKSSSFTISNNRNKLNVLNKSRDILTTTYVRGVWKPLLYNRSSIQGLHIVITTMIWKRHNIFKLWADGILRLINEFKEVKITVIVAGSEGESSRKLVEKYGFDYLEVPNFPLGKKANIRLSSAQKYNPDYVLLLGSDDILSNNMFLVILSKMMEKYDEIAALDIYYYDTISKKCTYSHGYQGKLSGTPIAPGRALSRDVLNRVNWELWSNEENDFLDGWAKDKINQNKKNHYYYSCRELGVVMCDIKSETNMTKFKLRFNHELISVDEIINHIPELKSIV